MEIFSINKQNIKVCNSFKDRLIGMMFKKKKSPLVYLFPRCNSVHTFFMFKKIDIVMTDKNGNILYYFKNVKPFRVLLPKKNVYFVYEFDSNSFDLKGAKKLLIN